MEAPSAQEVTGLLKAWGNGDEEALGKLMPLVYHELRRAARRYMAAERPNHTLQTTALVHEAYLRLVDVEGISFQNRAHFLAIAAQQMRRILIDMGRARQRQKRGGDSPVISLDETLVVSSSVRADILALDEALKNLATVDARQGQVVELRFFGGLSVEETAEVLKVSPKTVKRDWHFAKLWLMRELKAAQNDGL